MTGGIPFTKRNVDTCASGFDVQTINYEAYLIGKSIVMFTMMYCTLNWWMYRNARIESENKDDGDDKSKKP